MKKRVIVFVCLLLTLTMIFAGCAKKPGTNATGTVKTGLAVVTSIAKSTAATADKEGLAEVDSTVVALTIDQDGKIVKCVIDAAQTKIGFDTTGKVTTDLNTAFKTKQELGTEYGMKNVSGIKKEWKEQADAFAAYVIGKTVAEVKGISLNQGAPAGEDLKTSVTIHVTDFIAGIEKAANNAKDLGANAGDKLGLGIKTSISGSKNATAEKDGVAQAYTYYTATTIDANGKITSCVIDASQGNVNISTAGAVTSDVNAAVKTKQELGNDYGMKKASGIQKEWFEQADAFAAYAKGKTAAEVKGISLDEEGKPSGSDLKSSVTVHVGDFFTIIEKASVNAK